MNPHADDVAIIRGSETISSLTVKQAVMSACGPLDPNYGGETGLQGLLPLNTSFFQRFWRDADGVSLAYWEDRRGGGLNRQQPGQLQI